MRHTPLISQSPVDLDNCAREPIHVPGSIQPHGFLIAFRSTDTVITHVSQNIEDLGLSIDDVLGKGLDSLLGADQMLTLKAAMLDDLESANPLAFSLDTPDEARDFDAIVHENGAGYILELEEKTAASASFKSSFHVIRASLNRLNATGSLLDLAQRLTVEVRRITSFDRVMIYRFDPHYNGEVIAEDRREDLDPFLGLHYPAGDIPAQARALYERNWLRIIPSATYTPSPLLSTSDLGGDNPLDLSGSVLRSVSPIHCEYLTNMGVKASMSVSLMKDGRLWGLIACHHYASDHLVPYATRAASEFLGQTASLLLAAKQEDETLERDILVRSVQTQLLDTLAREQGDVALALTHFRPTFADLTGATGAALCLEGSIHTVGAVPPEDVIRQVADWALNDSEFFATDSLAMQDKGFEAIAAVASGVVAVALHAGRGSWMLWFRAEKPETVTWAGDPTEKISQENEDGTIRLSPRKSFAAWREELRNRSQAWTDSELRGAAELGRRIDGQLTRRLQSDADTARTLQQGLTLASIPEVKGAEFTAVYRPGDGGMVGGDWYDIVPMPDGRTALSLGDVAGHGLVAATTMGQLRNSLRAYLVEEVQSDVATTRLNKLVHWLLPNDIATGVVGIYEPENRFLRLTMAGHMPPVLIRNGKATLVQTSRAPALGISEQSRYAETMITLRPDDVFILYSDGLVESRRESLDTGFDRLLQSASEMKSFDSLCEQLLEDMRRDDSNDDIAILAMRVK